MVSEFCKLVILMHTFFFYLWANHWVNLIQLPWSFENDRLLNLFVCLCVCVFFFHSQHYFILKPHSHRQRSLWSHITFISNSQVHAYHKRVIDLLRKDYPVLKFHIQQFILRWSSGLVAWPMVIGLGFKSHHTLFRKMFFFLIDWKSPKINCHFVQ